MKLQLRKKSKDLVPSKNQMKKGLIVGPTPEMLIAQAIDSKVPVETMEKLLALMTRVKAERAKEAFFRDLAGFQDECPVINKTKIVRNKESKGGGVRYRYAPLDDIVKQVSPYLKKYGFSYTIQTVFEKDPPAIISILSVHHIGGHSRDSEFRVPIGSSEYMTEQQAHASASTFSKRYVFCNGFGILTGDEDNDAQDFTTQEGQAEGQTVEYIQVGHSELKEQIAEELKSSVFDNDRSSFENIMDGVKTVPSLNGMLKRVKRERKDREDAIQSEK